VHEVEDPLTELPLHRNSIAPSVRRDSAIVKAYVKTSPVSLGTIRRWRQLFGFTHEEAKTETQRYGRTTKRILRGNHTIFQIVNEMIDRLEYVPLSRAPPMHIVHGWKSSPHKAVVIRKDEEWEMIHILPKYIRQGETVYFRRPVGSHISEPGIPTPARRFDGAMYQRTHASSISPQ
jgi:hypothetical protein